METNKIKNMNYDQMMGILNSGACKEVPLEEALSYFPSVVEGAICWGMYRDQAFALVDPVYGTPIQQHFVIGKANPHIGDYRPTDLVDFIAHSSGTGGPRDKWQDTTPWNREAPVRDWKIMFKHDGKEAAIKSYGGSAPSLDASLLARKFPGFFIPRNIQGVIRNAWSQIISGYYCPWEYYTQFSDRAMDLLKR